MLIGRLVGSPVGVSGWGWEWVRWVVGRWLLHFFWTRQPSRARAKPKPNRVPFDKRGLLRSAKLCQMCPSCTCCYLTLPDHPQPSHIPHPPSNNQGTVGRYFPIGYGSRGLQVPICHYSKHFHFSYFFSCLANSTWYILHWGVKIY